MNNLVLRNSALSRCDRFTTFTQMFCASTAHIHVRTNTKTTVAHQASAHRAKVKTFERVLIRAAKCNLLFPLIHNFIYDFFLFWPLVFRLGKRDRAAVPNQSALFTTQGKLKRFLIRIILQPLHQCLFYVHPINYSNSFYINNQPESRGNALLPFYHRKQV